MEENKLMEPEKTFGHKFRLIHNCIEKYMDNGRKRDEIVLTGVQCATIRFLIMHKDQDIFQKDIEAAFSISGATATNILKGMEKKGLIERVPVAYDARLKKIILTDAAYQHDARAKKRVQRVENAITQGMTEEEKAQLGV